MLIRWNDPFRELQTYQNQVNRLLGDTFGSTGLGSTAREEGSVSSWAPPVDIAETPDALVFTVELPGFKNEDVSLHVENGILTLEGERKFEQRTDKKDFHRVERAYGRFMRSFSLPSNANPDKISAAMSDGVLRIELLKKEEAKPKTIPIGMGEQKVMGEQKQVASRSSRLVPETSAVEVGELVGAGTGRTRVP